jgi:hypothetical protein
MDESAEHGCQLRALAMRVAALEDNVAFLERWCEEQQDALDRAVGPVAYEYETDGAEPPRRAMLRVVDLRDEQVLADAAEADTIVAIVETEYDRRIRQIRAQLSRLRTRLAASLAPAPERDAGSDLRTPPRIGSDQPLSATPAGRTAP